MIRVETSADGWRRTLRLDAPERHNALTFAAMGALAEAVEAAGADPTLRVLVLTGTGRSFCAGAALDEVGGADMTRNPLPALSDAIERVNLPTIAALNGGVYGGGVEIALACDFRVAVADVRMQIPAGRLGIHYPAEGIERVLRRVGPQVTRRLFLLGERIEGEALQALGAVDRLVPAEAFETAVAELAEEIASRAPRALRGMKQTIEEAARGRLDRPAAEARVQACFASEDHAEGLAAAREKRMPRFRGR
ncbi:MAG: enoyl-CoA hydratase-related protein [Pseudomonadota bacterium]